MSEPPEDIAAASSEPSPILSRRRTGDTQQKASYLPDIHRLLPQAPDAEQGVLCSFLLAPREVYGLCLEKCVRAEHFHIPAHAVIYSRLCLMSDDPTKTIDLIALTQELRDHSELDRCGGPAFVTQLFTFLPTAANAAFYVEILMEKATLRKMISVCTEYAARSYEEQHEVHTLLDELETKVLAIGDSRVKASSIVPMKQAVNESIAAIDDMYERRGQPSGLTTGFHDIDKWTDGLKPELIIIAGLSSSGKTALAMNIAEHVALGGHPVGVFSLEMSYRQLVIRMLVSKARVNLSRVRDSRCKMSERDFPALTAAASALSSAKLYIDDSSGLTIGEIRAKARRMKQQYHLELLIIDFVQLIQPGSGKKNRNREQEVAEIAVGTQALMKELGIPIIVLAQVNAEGRALHPKMWALRESQALAHAADGVWFVVRPAMLAESDEATKSLEGQAHIEIAKQRNGPCGHVPLTFLHEFCRFETRAREMDEEERQPEFL